jgi:hypothetical protein
MITPSGAPAFPTFPTKPKQTKKKNNEHAAMTNNGRAQVL